MTSTNGSGAGTDDLTSENATHPLGRIRDLYKAMALFGLQANHQRIVAYVATTTDRPGTAHASLSSVTDDLGYRSRGTVWEAISAAQAAGFVETVPHPTDRRRTVWRIPLMTAPVDIQNPRGGTAHLTSQSRGEPQNSRGGTARSRGGDRAPSIGNREVKEEATKRDITQRCAGLSCWRDSAGEWHEPDPDCQEHWRASDWARAPGPRVLPRNRDLAG